MGGYGSGQGDRAAGRPLTCQRLALCVDEFRRQGLDLGRVESERRAWLALSFPLSGRPHVYTWRPVGDLDGLDGPPAAAWALRVQHNNEGPALLVPLDWRRVGYGWRPLWRCPECDRAARVLYAAPVQIHGAAPRWTCRACAGLAYYSTRVPDVERLTTRAARAAVAAGMADAWECSRLTLCSDRTSPRRPTGMHGRTHARRLAAWRSAQSALYVALSAELSRPWPAFFIGAEMVARSLANRAELLDTARAVVGRRIGR